MLNSLQQSMNVKQERLTGIQYRKRPEPCRVVSMASLRRIGCDGDESNDGPLVSHSGKLDGNNSWSPNGSVVRVEISPSSWKGLHTRMLSSLVVTAEVS